MKQLIAFAAVAVTGMAVAGSAAMATWQSVEKEKSRSRSTSASIKSPEAVGVPAGKIIRARTKDSSKKSNAKALPEDRLMMAKKKHAQDIFAGLTEGDFEKIERGASTMFGANIIEKWLAKRDFKKRYAYEGQMNALNYSLKELVRHAKHKNINGALTAYVQLSQTCVRCHSLIRDDGRK